MKLSFKGLSLGFLLWLSGWACLGSERPESDRLVTRFTILVGFPSREQPVTGVPLLVPGSVIPVGSGSGDEKDSVLEKSSSFNKVVERLWATFRLDSSRQPQKSILTTLTLGRPAELPPIENAGLAISATLVGLSDKTATFRVVFKQGPKPLADSTVNVAVDGRAVVGGVDGDSAPHIFVIVEPQTAGSGDKMEGLTAPVILYKCFPVYPEDARRKKISGVAVIEVIIDETGQIAEAKVLDSPDPSFSQAALEALKQWKFEPARRPDGKSLAVRTAISFDFKWR
ncbi:MAG: energy transducer TonB [Acidobacteriia bacterium]|nr:energy transducer TonB [Terriglobia bacterium]